VPMSNGANLWLLGCLFWGFASAASGVVTVQFVDPQRFIDSSLDGRREPPEANRALAEIRQHLLALGARCIADDQSLDILVHEVDLAGHDDWWHRRPGGGFRMLRDVVRSRLTLEYTWRASDGALLARSVERLDEAKFLRDGIRASTWGVAIPDEKAMITDWFEARFCRDAKAAKQGHVDR
jgi:hypothetical protein